MPNQFFIELIKTADKNINISERSEMLREFVKTDIYKKTEKENYEFKNKIFKVDNIIKIKNIVNIECRSNQHLKHLAMAFMPK